MNGNPSARVTPLMISAMRMACSSLSITHGPAMRKRLPAPMRTSPTWKEEIKSKIFHRQGRRERRDKSIKNPNWLKPFLGVLCDLGGRSLYSPSCYFFRAVKHLNCCALFLCPALRAVLIGRRDERAEQ